MMNNSRIQVVYVLFLWRWKINVPKKDSQSLVLSFVDVEQQTFVFKNGNFQYFVLYVYRKICFPVHNFPQCACKVCRNYWLLDKGRSPGCASGAPQTRSIVI